jgi:hypothetical protein
LRLRLLLSAAVACALTAVALPAWADKIAVLPFSSPKNLPKPELEQARAWTREAVTKKGHTFATPDEMVSAEAAVKDGVPDTSSEYIAAGKAVNAPWTIVARVERNDIPGNAAEEGYTTYRVELEACQVGTGRVESLSREILPGDSDAIAEMVALLVRPEGIANAEIPWERAGVARPKPKPKPALPPPPTEPPPPAPPPKPEEPPKPRPIYGAKHPLAIGASIGVSTALSQPDNARGPSTAMPIGGVIGYAFPDDVPGLEIKANITGQAVGPRALELSAGARYAYAPIADVPLFVGPEVLLGTFVALGAEKTARFLAHGSVFAAYAITENLQAELAGDLAVAAGGSGTLLLGGGTARFVVRF